MVYDLRRQGEDVITLSLGEAFFDIPLFEFRRLDFTRGYHYSDTQGLPELRERIAGYYNQHYGANTDPDANILVTAGSKAAIYMAMLVALDPGDEVVIHEPAWLSYSEQARLAGATVRFLAHDVPLSDISEHLGRKTKLVILCNPNNPAGKLYTADEIGAVHHACRNFGAFLLVDEAYSDFVLREGDFHSLSALAPKLENAVVVNSLSKNMGMSGWRIGYAIADSAFISRLLKVNQHIITCAPTVLQLYLASYFEDIIGVTLPQVRSTVEKRDRVASMMDDLRLERLGGDATFYFFVGLGGSQLSSYEFALTLLREHRVAVVPGVAYGASTDRFIRVGVGTESEERIHDALILVRELIRRTTPQ